MALCLALGAQGWRLTCQLVAEGLRLAAVGAAVGMLAAVLRSRWLARLAPTDGALTPWVWIAAGPTTLTGPLTSGPRSETWRFPGQRRHDAR